MKPWILRELKIFGIFFGVFCAFNIIGIVFNNVSFIMLAPAVVIIYVLELIFRAVVFLIKKVKNKASSQPE